MKKGVLIVVVGPTAIGKTSLCVELARELDSEVISADSRQFYKELSIGTAKPKQEELNKIPHHFIDYQSIEEGQLMSASRFEIEVLSLLESKFKNKEFMIMTGGSGLYINAVCNGFDEGLPSHNLRIRAELHDQLKKEGIQSIQERLKILDPIHYQKMDIHNTNRLLRALEVCLITGKPYSQLRSGKKRDRPFTIVKIGLELERDQLNERINKRVDDMIQNNLEQEVKGLIPFKNLNALQTVGYKEFFTYFDGKMSFDETVEKIKVNTRRYAKRQMTWFKKDSEIKWYKPIELNQIIQYIHSLCT